MATENEQKLVDLCFSIGLLLSTPGRNRANKPYNMTKWPIEKKAEWIAKQLRQAGFDTTPCGCLWGVLK